MFAATRGWSVFFLAVLLAVPQMTAAQPQPLETAQGIPTAMVVKLQPLNAVQQVVSPLGDQAALQAEDEIREAEGLAPRFAVPNAVKLTPENAGTWEEIDKELLVWRLRVTSPGALSLNLGFTRYRMPAGGRLMVYAADGMQVVRPFTDADNESHGELWTPVVLADDIVVEVTIPATKVDGMDLELGSINVGYRGFGEVMASLDDDLRSGSCNVDVICPEGDDWRAEIASVGVISTGGSTFCTGFMVNNTAQDLTPYFMTANHCGVNSSNAASLVVYWNYENSTCRPVGSSASGGPGDGSLSQFQTGSYFRASNSASDFTLVELDEDPDPAWEVSFAGWDRSGAEATTAVGIHHPNTDEKRISFEYATTQTTSYLGTTVPGDGSHVRVIDWDLGTTEPGSSGSPLFDQNHRVIGQLHGGYAACGNDESDWYGRFSVSWTGGGTSSTRLSNWLDPGGTGALTVDTISGAGITVSPGGNVEHVGPVGGPFTSPTVTYTLSNSSPASIPYRVRLTANFGILLNGGTADVTGTLAAGGGTAQVVVTLGSAIESLGAGTYVETIEFIDETKSTTQTRVHTVEIGQTLITVAPAHGLETGGPLGGPFNGTVTYTVTSERPTPVTVEVAASEPWISLNGVAGPLTLNLSGTGDFETVVVGISAAAEALGAGLYNGSVSFTSLGGGAGSTSRPITLEVGRVLYASVDVPKPINDNSTITSVIEVTDSFCVADVNVDVNITHTYRGDLTVELISPGGVTVRLHNRTGSSADDIITTYDDEGGTVPDGPGLLADFVNSLSAGTWTLRVQDHAGGDTGTLNSWALSMVPGGATCPPEAQSVSVTLPQMQTSNITLTASTGSGNPLEYIIESLPAHGILRDPNGGIIGSVPYTLIGNGNVVRYTPNPISYAGTDGFTFSAYDGQPSNVAEVSIVVGGPQLVHAWTLDTNPGWTTQGLWAWGQPTGGGGAYGNPDPTSGYTGANVYGYNLNGDYTNSMAETHLTSTPIDCTGLSGVTLKFWRWLGVERNAYDHAYVRVSNNGTTWTTIWENPSTHLTDSAWIQQEFDISAIADDRATVYLRWTMGTTDGSWTYCGWNIDDIEIWGLAPSIPGDCNGDGAVDLDDYVDMAACLSGPAAPVSGGCECFDLNGDGHVDLFDFSQFQMLMTE
jgi:subtilisin-like proprotein convertase family protein